ncbi:hypothetical protein JL720_5199 [Aureococcus anophagefferens]|nr:hypothetical protein JL720_5199 [Aureococcus anophagefferens]
MLTHVKPSHLSGKNKPDNLNTPEKLMRAARELGYEVIVAEYRSNALARMVSSWELKPHSAADATAHFCRHRGGLVRTFNKEYSLWQRGLRAAIHERLKVIELSFENVTRGLCAAVKRTTLALESRVRRLQDKPDYAWMLDPSRENVGGCGDIENAAK